MNVDWRLSDLTVGGVIALAFLLLATGYAVFGVAGLLVGAPQAEGRVIVGGFVALLAAVFVRESLNAEVDEACEHCGRHVHVDAARDGVSEAVQVTASGTPKRLQIGPIDIVEREQFDRYRYCSPRCADQDERHFLSTHDPDDIAAATPDDQDEGDSTEAVTA